MHKTFFAILFVVVICLNLVSIVLLPINIVSASLAKTTGHVQIKVLEANTLKPVSDATVCIIENHHYTTTNKNGDTSKIEIPIIRNSNYDNLLLRSWGEFTILIYKSGYSSHISFYNEVYAGITRIGIVCYLSPIVNSSDPLVTSNAQLPNQDYINTLVSHYKK